jgi:hypothetical protein
MQELGGGIGIGIGNGVSFSLDLALALVPPLLLRLLPTTPVLVLVLVLIKQSWPPGSCLDNGRVREGVIQWVSWSCRLFQRKHSSAVSIRTSVGTRVHP